MKLFNNIKHFKQHQTGTVSYAVFKISSCLVIFSSAILSTTQTKLGISELYIVLITISLEHFTESILLVEEHDTLVLFEELKLSGDLILAMIPTILLALR